VFAKIIVDLNTKKAKRRRKEIDLANRASRDSVSIASRLEVKRTGGEPMEDGGLYLVLLPPLCSCGVLDV